MKGSRWQYVAALAVIAAAFLVPQLWLLSLSFKTKGAVYQYPPRWIPAEPTLQNYLFTFTHTQVPWYLWNSAKIAALATLLTLVLAAPAAYVLSRERFRARRPLLSAFLVVQMLSPVIVLVPIYRVVQAARLLDTHVGLVLVYASLQVPFTTWVLKNFFDALPASIFEAARLDGASRLSAFWRIGLPLSAPGLAATTIFNIAAFWSEFALALVLLDSQERFTIPVGLFSMQGAYETEWHIVAAASIAALVPVLAAFVLMQRYFIAGLTAGALKG